jgi:hypothetical protein
MFFHKSVDATGETQNADFIYSILQEVVVEEVGVEHVVQIVTDNGSNYKKACEKFSYFFRAFLIERRSLSYG